MQDERVDKILTAMEQGEISEIEAERRLQQIIDQALSGKLEDSADMALVEYCQSLIWHLRTKGQFPYEDHALENERKLEKKLEKASRKKKYLPLIKTAAVAVCCLVLIGVGLFKQRWVDGHSSPDAKQYILQGHETEFGGQEGAKAQLSRDTRITTESEQEAIAFLGFDPGFPRVLMDEYQASRYYCALLPDWIDCQVAYRSPGGDIVLSVYYLFNPEEFVFSFEQNTVGYQQMIHGYNVYIAKNITYTTLTWSEDNRVYIISGHILPDTFPSIIHSVMKGK